MNPTKYLLASVALVVVPVALAGDLDQLSANQLRYYEAIKPIESEQKWKKIPWMTRLDEAVKVAAKEKRPVCVWVVDNEPLDRC